MKLLPVYVFYYVKLIMDSCIFILLIFSIIVQNCQASEAKVFMVLMDEEPVLSLKNEEVYARSDLSLFFAVIPFYVWCLLVLEFNL